MILLKIECRVDSLASHAPTAPLVDNWPPRVHLYARVSIWKSLYTDFHKTEATRRVQWPNRRVRFESAFSKNMKVVRNCVYFSEHFESCQSELRFMRYGQNTDKGSSCPATSFFLQNPRSKPPIASSTSFSIRACLCYWKWNI